MVWMGVDGFSSAGRPALHEVVGARGVLHVLGPWAPAAGPCGVEEALHKRA
jgi:hypothetical protein